jgi:hypothetical protein
MKRGTSQNKNSERGASKSKGFSGFNGFKNFGSFNQAQANGGYM